MWSSRALGFVALMILCTGYARAQSTNTNPFREAYPLCFDLYPDEATDEHAICIEISARYASSYEREGLAAAVQQKVDEQKRAKAAEERMQSQRSASASDPNAMLEFKGIALGSDMSIVEDTGRYTCRDPQSPIADRICSLKYGENETIAGVPVRSIFLHYYSGKLENISITLEEGNFSQVSAALVAKYGKGHVRTETLRNRMGAAFENNIFTWRRGKATLEAKRYFGKLDVSAITYRSDFALEEFTRRRGASTKARAKDL